MKLPAFISHVETGLSKLPENAKSMKTEGISDMFETLLSSVEDSDREEGLKYITGKAKELLPRSIADLVEEAPALLGDSEAIIAMTVNGMSQSINDLALDVTRRNVHGSDSKDFFGGAMSRLTKALIDKLHLRGIMVEMGIKIPDDTNAVHWTKTLFENVTSVSAFQSLDWKVIDEIIQKSFVIRLYSLQITFIQSTRDLNLLKVGDPLS